MQQAKTYKTMAEALEDLKRRGFTANFEWLDNTFRGVDDTRTFQPHELTIVEHHRFEGMSDPDDQSVVYAIQATDGTRGVVADGYGLSANPDLGEFLKTVRMRENL